MYWTKEERQAFWERNQVGFAEKAYEFRCCDVPTITKCLLCTYPPDTCKNRAEAFQAIINHDSHGGK